MNNRLHLTRRATITLSLTIAAVFAMAPLAAAEAAEVEVEWDEDGMGFSITSDKGISNVIVLLCDGTAHKHEDEFNGNQLTWDHRETQQIVAIWVKSGSNHNPEGPAPPEPFNNPGAGEYFENPVADCEGGGEPVCVGVQDISARHEGETIVVSWTAFDNATTYTLYRSTPGGPTLNFTVQGTEHLDSSVVVGTTYTYFVTAMVEGGETDVCDTVEITAIPVFPGVIGLVAAAVAGLGAYVLNRRRA